MGELIGELIWWIIYAFCIAVFIALVLFFLGLLTR